MLEHKRTLKVLDFDIENRPLSYWVPDKPTAEITAIASCWHGAIETMSVDLLGIVDPVTMLNSFVARYNAADIVTGHYIRKHDLPIINGALMEYGLPALTAKLTVDTRLDMYKKGDIPATQEYLGELLLGSSLKVHMTQMDWRDANRLTPTGIAATKKRVAGDVLQHMALRKEMAKRGLLSAPKLWHP